MESIIRFCTMMPGESEKYTIKKWVANRAARPETHTVHLLFPTGWERHTLQQLHIYRALLKMGRYYNTTMHYYWDMLVK